MMVGQWRAMCWTIGCAVRLAASTLLESESERQARAYLPESESGSSTFWSLLVGTLVFHHQQNNTYSFQNKITFYRGQLRCDSTKCRCPLCHLDHLLVVPETRFVQKNVGCDNEKYDIDTTLPGLWIKKRTSNSKVFHLKSRFTGYIDNCLREYELPWIEIPQSN